MKMHSQKHGQLPHCARCRTFRLLYPDIQRIRADQQKILGQIVDKQEDETKYLNARETWERVGISESTLLRCQRRGEITVAKVEKRKKYFRYRDVERLKKAYWRRE